jgi:hypothetical protein
MILHGLAEYVVILKPTILEVKVQYRTPPTLLDPSDGQEQLLSQDVENSAASMLVTV